MARFHCSGSNTEPLPIEREEGWASVTKVSETLKVWHSPDKGICDICHEPKKLLKSGKLAKHSRNVSWRAQEQAKIDGVDLGPKLKK